LEHVAAARWRWVESFLFEVTQWGDV
jgi:hypothetical protein